MSEQSLQRILHNATRGPSAGFSQGQAFLVLRGDDLARFWELDVDVAADPVRTAQVLVVPFAVKNAYLERYARPDKGLNGREPQFAAPYWYTDTGMAALLVLQTVVDEGLGALFFGLKVTGVDRFREAFGVPADHEPIGAIAIGHSDESKPVQDSDNDVERRGGVIHHGRW
nr:Nitroreductase family protein [Kibdelosporangium sp. MJ126-NF4]